jgi:hydrogenase/urease accessory protein HupE
VSGRRRLIAACVVAGAVAAARDGAAHQGGSTGYASIVVDGESIRYSVTLWPAAAPASVADDARRALAGDVGSRERLLGVLGDKLTFLVEGQRCRPSPMSPVAPAPGADRLTLVVDFTCPAPVRDLVVRDDVFDVFGSDYHALARIDAPGFRGQFAFTSDNRETRIAVGGGRGLPSFFLLGVEHILTGYDHLLFLLALLLPGGGVLALTKIITAFTVAHSVTLSLATLDIVRLPDRAIEAVIALSIAAVAAENLFLRPSVRRRWIISFCFGLVHGFGFSSALREIGLPAHHLALSLLGFNVGVEVGQALVVTLALPVMLILRKSAYEHRMIQGSSLAILLVGLVLFAERVFS